MQLFYVLANGSITLLSGFFIEISDFLETFGIFYGFFVSYRIKTSSTCPIDVEGKVK